MLLKKMYEFELELVDVIEDVIIHNNGMITLLIRRSNLNPESNQLQITMSVDQFDQMTGKCQTAQDIIETRYADAIDERRKSHAE